MCDGNHRCLFTWCFFKKNLARRTFLNIKYRVHRDCGRTSHCHVVHLWTARKVDSVSFKGFLRASFMHPRTHAHTHTHANTRTHTHTHANTHTHTPTHTRTREHTHTRERTRTDANGRAHTQTHPPARAHTHTRTHTHNTHNTQHTPNTHPTHTTHTTHTRARGHGRERTRTHARTHVHNCTFPSKLRRKPGTGLKCLCLVRLNFAACNSCPRGFR